MTTYRAVVKYAIDASRAEKIAALKEGLTMCALELAELGVSLSDIEDATENAYCAVEWHA